MRLAAVEAVRLSMFAATYDISKLPKVRTHAQLGRVGWTSSDVDGAEQELVESHQWLIDFANIIAQLRDEAIANNAPQSIVQGFVDSLETQKDLVQQHTAVMNEFYAKTGAGVSGFLGRTRFKGIGLGSAWIVPATQLAEYLGILGRQLYWVYLTYIVGQGVQSLKTNAEAAKTEAVNRTECYKLWREAIDAGRTPPNCTPGAGGSTDWETVALIGGSLFLVMMLMKRR